MNRRAFLRTAAFAAAALPLASLRSQAVPPSGDDAPIFYDADGLIVHRGMDGGDTAQREGWYWLGVWVRENVLKDPWKVPRALSFKNVIRLLEPAQDGVFFRHPKLPPWNNPHDKAFELSRDKMMPLVA